jgi:hypothetical protein
MTGEQWRSANEDLGSVGEEAAKLFSALQDWAQQAGSDPAGTTEPEVSPLAAGLRGITDHLATGGPECVWCPVCQVIHRVRRASPEVREHLATAASSLLQAVAALLEPHAASAGDREGTGLEHIDLEGTD